MQAVKSIDSFENSVGPWIPLLTVKVHRYLCRQCSRSTDPFANNVDPDETGRLIYTVCRSIIDFRLKSLFATTDVSKFRDG